MWEKIPTAAEDKHPEDPKVENPTESVKERVEKKLRIGSTYEDLENTIPEVSAMKGVDQRSDFHDLTLDNHTKEVEKKLEEDDFIGKLDQRTKELVLLAAKLHDLGKMTPEGQQVHPKDPEKRQYAGHEKESERIANEIIPKYFDLSPEEAFFVSKIVGLHASAMNLVNNFEKNNQPKGSDLKAYDGFLQKIEELPSSLELIEKLRIILALNKADKQACVGEQGDRNSGKVKKIEEGIEKQSKVLDEMAKAWPALVEAIKAKRFGDQKAGIIIEGGEYKYNNQ